MASAANFDSFRAASASPTIHLQPDDHYFHAMTEPKNVLAEIVQDIANRHAMQLEICSQNWLIKLSYKSITRIIVGFNLGLNSDAATAICDDKSATSSVLGRIPHIEHRIFRRPGPKSRESLWQSIYQYAFQYGFNMVCKQNSGSGGKGVFHTRTPQELESTVHELFSKHPAISLCPYQEIQHEYRVIMLNGEPKVIFDKIRPHIVADGKQTTQDLVIDHVRQTPGSNLFALLGGLSQDLHSRVLPRGRLIHLNWKHNLAQGAVSKLIAIPSPDQLSMPPRVSTRASKAANPIPTATTDIPNVRELIDLAKRAVRAIGVRIASVDVVELRGGKLNVLEINGGTMMENLVRQHGEVGRRLATEVYEEAIMQTFAEEMSQFSPATSTEGSTASSRSSSPIQRPPVCLPLSGSGASGIPPSPPRTRQSYQIQPTASRTVLYPPPSPPSSSQDVEMN